MSIHLEAVEVEDFRSFLGGHSTLLPHDGLVNLEGINRDTGGSSGSGKSSVALAISYALGFCPIPATELGCWDAPDKSPSVRLRFSVDGDTVILTRGKKMELMINGILVEGSVKQKEEKLDQLFGLSAEMRAALTYRGQRQPGLFLSKTDSEKKEFLTKVLRLYRFEDAVEDAVKKANELQIKLTAAGMTLVNLEEERAALPVDTVSELEDLVSATKQNEARWTREAAELRTQATDIRQSIDQKIAFLNEADDPELNTALEALKNAKALPIVWLHRDDEVVRLEGLVQQCQERLKRAETEEAAAVKARQAKVQDLQQKINTCNVKAAKAPLLLVSKTKLETELVKLQSRTCPTCEREWNEGSIRELEVSEELASVEQQLVQISTALGLADALKAELAEVPNWEPNPLVQKLRDMTSAAQVKLADLNGRYEANNRARLAERSKAISDAELVINEFEMVRRTEAEGIRRSVQSKIDELEQQALSLDRVKTEELRRLGVIQAQLGQARADSNRAATLDASIATMKEKIEKLDIALKEERDFAAVAGREGFLGSVFDEILDEISQETNHILGAVANTRHVTLHFRSENVTQKGSIKREIKPVVSISGREAPLRSGLSGGMLSAVELAVDLAVGKVVSGREGVTPGWLILDETFDGLDPVSKGSCLEILQEYARDRLVLIVDHMSETKGLFTKKITVEYKRGESRFASN